MENKRPLSLRLGDIFCKGYEELEELESMERNNNTLYNGYIIDETNKAVLFNVMIGTKLRKVWFPKSVISFYTDPYFKSQYRIVIPNWLAKSKSLY